MEEDWALSARGKRVGKSGISYIPAALKANQTPWCASVSYRLVSRAKEKPCFLCVQPPRPEEARAGAPAPRAGDYAAGAALRG